MSPEIISILTQAPYVGVVIVVFWLLINRFDRMSADRDAEFEKRQNSLISFLDRKDSEFRNFLAAQRDADRESLTRISRALERLLEQQEKHVEHTEIVLSSIEKAKSRRTPQKSG